MLGYPGSLSYLHNSEIRTQWLAHFLSGKFVLPSIKEMEADIGNYFKHIKRITPFHSKYCLATFQIWDNDNLCRDMGWNPMRKKNWFCELFSPYSNLDYRKIQTVECQRKSKGVFRTLLFVKHSNKFAQLSLNGIDLLKN